MQIVEKRHGVRRILEHLGSAHDEAELAALMRIGQDKLHVNQPALDLPGQRGVRPGVAVIEGKRYSPWRMVGTMSLNFLKFFVLDRYFLYGFWGFVHSVNVAYMRFMKFSKFYEQEELKKYRYPD